MHLHAGPFRIKEIVSKGSPRQALADPLFQALPEDHFGETERFHIDTPSEPLHSDHDLSTPGYGVEFTWRTDMVWMKVRGVFFVFFGSAVDEVGAHEIFYGRTASSKRARGSK